MAGMHARDGQLRDAIATRIRDTWVRACYWLHWDAVTGWRELPAYVRALNAILLDALPLISRRAGRVAGGAPAPPGAPEAPAPDIPRPGAGASPELRYADPEAPAAPASPGAARPPWDAWPPPRRTMPDNRGRGAAGRRETIAMAALRDPVPSYYRAHLAAQDMAVMSA